MPISPRTQQDGSEPEGSSNNGKKQRKGKSRPTTSRRNQRQKLKERYAKAREDAQLAGMIPTIPEEALKPERVDPSTQSPQPLSELIEKAIKKGWATEDAIKPQLVEEMIRIVMDVNMPAKAKIAAFSALRTADESQWMREHPSASNVKGGAGAIAISVQTNISATELMNRMLTNGAIRLEQISGSPSTPIVTSSAGSGGLTGKVEASPALADDKPEASASMGNSEQ